jgi:hypothetical protein
MKSKGGTRPRTGWRDQRPDDPIGHRFGVGVATDQHRELVAAQARADVAIAQTAPQPLGHGDQQLVADQMTQRVVDELEAVQVQEQHGGVGALAVGACEVVLEAIKQQRAVAQAGEPVGDRAKRSVVGARDRQRHLHVLAVGRHRGAVLFGPAAVLGGGDDEGADHVASLGDRNTDDRTRARRRQARAGVVGPQVLQRNRLAGRDDPAAHPLGDRGAAARPF